MLYSGLYSIVATNVAGSVHSSAMIHVEESELDYYFLSNLKGKDIRFRNLNVRNYYDYGDEIGRGTQGVHHHVVERASGKLRRVVYSDKFFMHKGHNAIIYD
jgi:hypothetical protein